MMRNSVDSKVTFTAKPLKASTTNPFEYGGIVGESSFCNRTQELADLSRAAQNGDRLLVYAERRMGKTSLVQRTAASLDPASFISVYVDAWPTSDAVSLAKAIATATVQASESRVDKALEAARSVVRRLVPSLTADPDGTPVVQFGARVGDEPEPILEDALDAPARLAERAGKRVVVIYDEVQRLSEYASDAAERLLRSRTQAHSGVAYLFCGSRKHLIREMFMDRDRPLYQAAGHYPIGPIGAEHWLPFVTERFERAARPISSAVVHALTERTDGHPYYTQHLAHALWEITPPGERATEQRLSEALGVVLSRLAYPFTVTWEAMTSNQRALMTGLAARGGAHVFSSSFLQQIGLASSSASRAAESLMQSGVVDRDESGYLITDRFLRLWVRLTFPT